MIWRQKLVAVLYLTFLLLFAAIGDGARAGGSLRTAGGAEPETLDPTKAVGALALHIGLDLFEGLTAYGSDGTVAPGIATSWETSPDGLRWIFHLRPDAKWSNGDPLTSEDFLYAFRRRIDPATAASYPHSAGMIVNAEDIIAGREKDPTRLGVEAPDAQTLIINLRNPVPSLLAQLTILSLPVHRKTIETYGAQWVRPGNIVSNGPFILTEWTPQVQLVLHRNPFYYAADQVQPDEVHWTIVEDNETAWKQYRAGELDISRLPETELAAARKTYPGELHQTAGLAIEALIFNMRVEPFASNLKLRQALALAIDRDVLNSKVVDPGGQISTASFVPTMGTDYQPQVADYTKIPEQARVATARKLMIEAGYPPDKPLRLTATYPTSRGIKKRLQAIAAMWKQALGVDLTLQNHSWQTWLSTIKGGDFQLSWEQMVADIVDPLDFLRDYRSTSDEIDGAGYHNSAYDDLLAAAEAEPTPSRRTHLLEQAEHLLLNDTPLIPIDNPLFGTLVSARVTGWRDNIIGLHPSRYLGIQAPK
ncbi:MAG: oligopeptide transport system substrate-binding protein [Aliidongia sp.]|nr:oligopeptide transport system substrate-binding protein [Aliidongia sp.]